MDWQRHITVDPGVMHGVACFAGTRIPVSVVLDNLADGASTQAILAQYPGLSVEHLASALGYAAALARDRLIPVPA